MQKQFIRTTLCVLAILLTFQVTSLAAFAQSSPALSPWLGLLDRSRDASGLDNYNRLVKPRQQMLRNYANQASQIQAQQRALRSLQSNTGVSSGGSAMGSRDLLNAASSGITDGSGKNMLLSAPREIPSSQAPAGFNQYLHYYPSGGLIRQPVPNFSSTGRRR